MIEEIAQYIENVTAWTIGVDLFIGGLPKVTQAGTPPPARCVVVLENTPAALVPQLPDRQDKEVQLFNRAKNYLEARADAMAIYRYLHGRSWVELPVLVSGEAYTAMVIDAVGSPAPIAAPNAQGLYEFSTNYIFRIKDKNA